MTKALENMTNKALAAEIEARGAAVDAAQHVVFAQIERTDVPFNTIVRQLGTEHPAVADHHAKLERYHEAITEAGMRVGPEPAFMRVTYLLKSPRYVRVRSAA